MPKRDIYIAIMVACERGRGITLSASEVIDLSLDDAISQAAINGLGPDEFDRVLKDTRAWAKINPAKDRTAANSAVSPERRR